ncbi:hypothetical protein [Pseudoplusia includens SNPV IE]|uniref:Uncharacterized protein n=2 Tax=Chrysodeixis includens nucleopolyhedrovirus TaxID=1207438 RepID=A0A1C8ZXY7_9ABAC|nr:hypothetical protein [Pseudoplusia includens SNPV IE]AOL56565.1 hypothetical protein [Chrysodeixis includens nucleopolyhedrovirus]AJD80818.1 hypothetical protein [Pseudoplusia includens SNPV IE]AOL56706.1 hypothetical protein [Chrysodeixis includens nucleopolyhedrovirus]AOL56848.1 hypothetical protein [Chrysodeixis includens nucleopolyhedrovirus]AOL56990.1 hypothetical protein [Chrysodeixis includens nucleopolyhedrovirus]
MKSRTLAHDSSGFVNANHLYTITSDRQKYHNPHHDRMYTSQYNYKNYQNDLSYSPAAWNKLTTNERTNVIYEKCKYAKVDSYRLQGRDNFRCEDILKITAHSQPSSYSTTIDGDTSAIVSSATPRGVVLDTIAV